MPRKSKPESEAEQSERFQREAQKLIDAGELDPSEGARQMDRLIHSSGNDKPNR